MKNECGFRGLGHYCTEGKVQFISRYQLSNDYCIDGRRVSVDDEGNVRNDQEGDIARIYAFELSKHQEYLRWHTENVSWLKNEPYKFRAGICKAFAS